jgi:hypothetical protein
MQRQISETLGHVEIRWHVLGKRICEQLTREALAIFLGIRKQNRARCDPEEGS